MTGGRCHRRSEMMCRGAEGGCGTDAPSSRVSEAAELDYVDTESAGKQTSISPRVDVFSQARKTLSERCPFDVPEERAGTSGNLSVCTLPSGLASLLKRSDGRKKHKKSHSSTEKKSSRASERSKGRNIWVETDDYFRDLTLPDIDALFEVSTSSRLFAGSENFLIPCIGVDWKLAEDTVELVEDVAEENKVVLEYEVHDDTQCRENGKEAAQCYRKEEKFPSLADSGGGIEWLAGCRNRNVLTSEQPSKKRKLLALEAGFEKVLVGAPCEGNLLCDFCCRGELGSDLNQLIACTSCKVAVHRQCYGMQGVVDVSTWLCSWCKHNMGDRTLDEHPCVLCPKKGGALKPLSREKGRPVTEFAHLFCSLWMSDVYIEDLKNMEPIVNVGGVKETKKRLLCSLCRVKCGACIQCSHGSCRATFHPKCAREGSLKMEVWGRYGCNDVELRAFCSKHSDNLDGGNKALLGDPLVIIGSGPSIANCSQNGKKVTIGEASVISSDDFSKIQSQEVSFTDSASDAILELDGSDVDQLGLKATTGRSDPEDANLSETLNLSMVLKKLIDRGKVNVKDAASEIGISPDCLIANLADNNIAVDLKCKLIKWLRNLAYLVSDYGISNPVAVKSVPPRRRTRSNIGILKDEKDERLTCSSLLNGNGVPVEEGKEDNVIEEIEGPREVSATSAVEEKQIHHNWLSDSLAVSLPKLEEKEEMWECCKICPCTVVKDRGSSGIAPYLASGGAVEGSGTANTQLFISTTTLETSPSCKAVSDSINRVVTSGYVHPYICRKPMDIELGLPVECNASQSQGLIQGDPSRLKASFDASICCNHKGDNFNCNGVVRDKGGPTLEQVVKAKESGVLQMSPADEVEGELLYFQHKLLDNAVARKQFTDKLIHKVTKSLPSEIDATRTKKWDTVLANKYLSDLREAKKQGRKERRHKEAQAVLAAATAAAASSSRNPSLRKDMVDEYSHQEKFNSSNGRVGTSAQIIPKETLSRVVPRTSSYNYSDSFQSASDFSKENPRSCDICRRSETILNPILVCSGCKVAVHLDCYRSVNESTGPWHCEVCAELSTTKSSGTSPVNFWDKPYFVAECCLCGGTTGAFRKTSDGQWVHAFCAEWIFETTFRRGQVNPVGGMDTVSKGGDCCCICNRKHGVCIKCSYGHCKTTFHPSCARSTGFHMNVKILAGKYQHKAYCEKHSLEQRAKAETQKHGVEDLKNMKQIRVELERLRLLCERIVKREKIKRDLVICSQSILACRRDHLVRSLLAHSPFFPPEVSSESATTSLKGNTDGYRSYSDAVQRSDDVTVDTAVSGKRRIKVTMSMDADQKTEDSSTSQNIVTPKPVDRPPYGGKQIPRRPSPGPQNPVDDREWSSASKKNQTFEKELIMTSDQASMKNRQLPKGYIYIPVNCLPKEKQTEHKQSSGEPLCQDG